MIQPVNIVLADDHAYFRTGFKQTLESFSRFKVVGEAENGKQLLELCRALKPDLVITDLVMPQMDGKDAIAEIMKAKNPPMVMVLTAIENDKQRYDLLAAGAKGYMPKDITRQELLSAIETVMDGPHYYCQFDNAVLQKVMKDHPYPALPATDTRITKREIQVLQLLQDEKTTKEIAEILFVTPKAIAFHRLKLLKKTGAKNTIGLILYAIKNGLIKWKG